MPSIAKFITAAAAGFLATTGVALAAPNFVPEPGSVALAVAGLAAAVYFARK